MGYDFGSMTYPDQAGTTIEYYYDNNGNLTKNLDQGIVAIRNNFLNLPDTIQFQNGNQIINSYLADGRKVKAVYKTYSTGIVVPQDTVYHGNASYDISTDEWDGHYMYRSWVWTQSQDVYGARTNADQLIKNKDGSFTIVETKRSSTTPLTKGQKAAQKHVNSGNGIFEVRSNRPNQGLHKGDKIRVKEYNRVNKK